jgi:hypothetical protein
MMLGAIRHHHPYSQQPDNIEVVVNVHVRLTTSSEQSQLGVITNSKPELMTSEVSDREQTDCTCMFMGNCSNLPATFVEEGIRELAPSSFEIFSRKRYRCYVDSVAEQAIIQRCPQSKYLDFLIVQIRLESRRKLECCGSGEPQNHAQISEHNAQH